MEIEHSRLLKLLRSNKSPKMSEKHNLHYVTQLTQPSFIESEVPEQQNLREPAEIVNDLNDSQNNNPPESANDDSTFVPVFKTTKEEAVFTKGDLKLQKISVTENISINSEVIETPQSLRSVQQDDNKTGTDENKPKSRIPKLRQAAEKFKKAMKEEREKEKEENSRPRRSSIPKLKRSRRRSSKDIENKNIVNVQATNEKENVNNKPLSNNNERILPPDEEFDKIFDEIINVNDPPVIDSGDLVDSLEDAEKLEYSFEEIVHNYEENKPQPIIVNETKHKIPLVRQKSLPEETIVRQTERKLSLKNIRLDGDENSIESNAKLSKLEEIKRKFERKRNTDDNNTPSVKQEISGTEIKLTQNVEDFSSTELKKYTEREELPTGTDEKNKKSNDESDEKGNTDLESNERTPNTAKVIITIEEQNNPIEHEVQKMYEKPHLIEDTLPAMKRDYNRKPEKQITKESPQNTFTKFTAENREGESKTADEDHLTSTKNPLVQEEASQHTSKYALSEQALVSPSKKEFVDEIPKKRSINVLSRIAEFSKNNDDDNQRFKNNSKIIQKDNKISNDEPADDMITPSKEIDDTKSHNTNFNNDLKFVGMSVTETKVRSFDKLTFPAIETTHTENPDFKNKLYIHKILTPPNTPQIYQYDDYKDSSHGAGEPKVLNIDDEASQEYKLAHKTNENHEVTQDYKEKLPKTKKSAQDVYNKFDFDGGSPTTDLCSPNLDGLNRAQPFEVENKHSNEDTDYDYSIIGKVNRLVNRIDSVDEKTLDIPMKENIDPIPIKKSVSSRIAMFERQTSTPSELRFVPKPRPKTEIKPRIIEEVLKAPPSRGMSSDTVAKGNPSSTESNKIQIENIGCVAQVIEIKDLGLTTGREEVVVTEIENAEEKNHIQDEMSPVQVFKESIGPEVVDQNNIKNPSNIRIEDDETTRAKESNQISKIRSAKEILQSKKTLPRQEKEVLVSRIKERIQRFKAVNENGEIKKSTIVAEVELGDAVKGKVHQLIVRMNSMEKIELEKRYNGINIKEKPRSRSVSEKIALFEKKSVPIEIDTSTTAPITMPDRSTLTTPANTSTTDTCPKPRPHDEHYYQERIEELKNGKLKYGTMDDMVYVELRTGQKMPALILGTALLDPTLLPHIISTAIDLGYRAIDTAFIYGNEKQIGDVIRAKIDDGTVTREELFIIGKLWSTFHRRDLVEKACRASLEQLGLEYFDLYLIHNPMAFKEGGHPLPQLAKVLLHSPVEYLEAWYGMEDVAQMGLAKSIGVSNFNSVQIGKVVDKGRIKPSLNQVECHPYLTQQRLDQFCADRGVKLACFGTLGSKGTPAEYKSNQESVIDDPLVKVMAAGLNITPAQLLIRYQIECGHGVVVKSSSAAHLWENLLTLKMHLSDAEVDALNALNRNKRTYALIGMGETHRNYPFNIQY